MSLDIKKEVQKYYGEIAENVSSGLKGGCGCGCNASCCGDITSLSVNYNEKEIEGLPKEALNVSLGCANPLLFAKLKEGEAVLDLGSGGGIDVLIASKYVGSSGKVYGLDMTDSMLRLANENKEKMGVSNVEFIKGYIEDIPLDDETVDVIMSNCVINLSEDKEKALSEAYRVLKNGGRLAIADIVTLRDVPDKIREKAELWAGCIAGTIKIDEYKAILERVGFKNVEIEPVHVYTKEVIKGLIKNDNGLLSEISEEELNLVDAAFAGAHIKAEK